jgi:tRNA(fMet)-specific endonuclease VapC
MSLYVVDTDTLSLFQHGNAAVERRVRSTSPTDLAVSIITVEEQLSGWYSALRRVKRPDEIGRVYDNFTATLSFLAGLQWQFLSFSLNAVHRFDALVSLRLPIGRMDLRIAAIALENQAIVVTRNVRDFGRVPGLTIEDWTQ